MNLNRFKPGQLKCVTTLDAPLVVSAGAGSGKTFTLTQRIAWALLPGSAPDGGAFLDGIEQVMAITFTEKAAGEIKSRVKATLRAEGMADEALKVDDAWISTIHGMCSRILRTHAVELGIDPAFSVLDPAHADDMLRMSVQKALSSENEFVSPRGFNALFSEYAARSTGHLFVRFRRGRWCFRWCASRRRVLKAADASVSRRRAAASRSFCAPWSNLSKRRATWRFPRRRALRGCMAAECRRIPRSIRLRAR